jgi:NAD(P)-dependent dehydrogenase (short-subunit alcohol dehydrogenase family)
VDGRTETPDPQSGREDKMLRLTDKIAIVTGAAQGIGASFARGLAADGAKVVIADVGDGTETAESIVRANGTARYIKTDVSKAADVKALVEQVTAEFGTIDILVNNAAIFAKLGNKKFQDISSEEFDAVMAVNVRGPFECAKAVAPVMIAQGSGKIVNIASGTVFKGVPNLLHYVSSKGAVVAMTRCLAREFGPHNVNVNAIAPGLTMSDGVLGQSDWTQDYIEANKNSRALKRRQVPNDLVGTVVFLSSPDSDFMTGQTLVVDGGAVMH